MHYVTHLLDRNGSAAYRIALHHLTLYIESHYITSHTVTYSNIIHVCMPRQKHLVVWDFGVYIDFGCIYFAF